MEREGSKRVELAGLGDKHQITATFAVTLNGQFLPMQLLYQGKTSCCHPRFSFPCEFDVFHTPNHWANEDTCIHFTENILMPYITKVREEWGSPNQPAILIMDKFRWQVTNPVQENLEDHKILVVAVPAGTTDKLQPLDLSVNKAAKNFIFYETAFTTGMQSKLWNSFRIRRTPTSVCCHDYNSNERT